MSGKKLVKYESYYYLWNISTETPKVRQREYHFLKRVLKNVSTLIEQRGYLLKYIINDWIKKISIVSVQ